jgi:ribulose-5-phosphate 4-epimerase/fuculose-1-phosphate aldolase
MNSLNNSIIFDFKVNDIAMQDEGYIKYKFDLQKQVLKIDQSVFENINHWRSRLYKKMWIGIYDNGVGYGNISVRISENDFYISGTATGGKEALNADQYTIVDYYNIEQNYIKCKGLIAASSESLSHAALYSVNNSIHCIIHIHDSLLWNKYLNKLPTTSTSASYGTTNMANALQECVLQMKKNFGVIIMGGHEDGIIAFGENLEQAYDLLNQL